MENNITLKIVSLNSIKVASVKPSCYATLCVGVTGPGRNDVWNRRNINVGGEGRGLKLTKKRDVIYGQS